MLACSPTPQNLRWPTGRFGGPEKLGMDEVYLDVTERCRSELEALRGAPPPDWEGFVHHSAQAVVPETRYRVQDLRASAEGAELGGGHSASLCKGEALLR